MYSPESTITDLVCNNQLIPLYDKVLVSRKPKEEKTLRGLYIPDSAKEKPQEGKVIAVGQGRIENGSTIPLQTKSGDNVLFGKYAGTEININGEEFLLLREEEILGILIYG